MLRSKTDNLQIGCLSCSYALLRSYSRIEYCPHEKYALVKIEPEAYLVDGNVPAALGGHSEPVLEAAGAFLDQRVPLLLVMMLLAGLAIHLGILKIFIFINEINFK